LTRSCRRDLRFWWVRAPAPASLTQRAHAIARRVARLDFRRLGGQFRVPAHRGHRKFGPVGADERKPILGLDWLSPANRVPGKRIRSNQAKSDQMMEKKTAEEDAPTIYCEAAAKLNFACHQNAYPVLRELRVENNASEKALSDLVLTLEADPAFVKGKSWTVDRVDPKGVVAIRGKDIELDAQFMLDLTESVRGSLKLRLERDGVVLAEASQPIELLARTEWGGAGYMPELLAAFCAPNDPSVDRVLKDAARLLRQAGKRCAIDGYESGSRERAWEIASAIYAVVSNLGLAYAMPPASFERDGQKVRMPSQVAEGGVATCLDSALLLAAAFEQAGLNPIVALLNGHALVGVWLQPEKLASITNDEAEVLRKRCQLKELVLLESTFVTNHPAPPFSAAVKAAMDLLAPERDAEFITAVDIARARAHRISPLGFRTHASVDSQSELGPAEVKLGLEEAPLLPDFDEATEDEKPETPAGRIERWQRKLLDLSARNPLLNHRSSKSSLPIFCPDPALLEDTLAAGAKFTVVPAPKAATQEQDRELHRQRTGEVIDERYARDALESRQVLVALPKEELDRRLVQIYRKAQTSLQEGGANTLYLALGFLLWKRDTKDERRFRAPLILLPVSLQRQSVRSGVKMLAHDDEPRFNTTLLEMLRKDFGIEISGLEGALPQDDSGVHVSEIWNRVRRAVKESAGFEVVEDVVLGHFSFAKYLMWKDLADRLDALRQSSVVRHLIDSPRDPYASDVEFVDAAEIDREFRPADVLAPLPADSSQMAAIASADRKKDFIIIGPPGTGKSQTISNLIAHLLGKGRTVLFVSEKTAALDVVYRRLADIGLGRFCLELHSNKARKVDVLKQLEQAWNAGLERAADDWQREAQHLEQLRDRLNEVVHHLHRRHPNGLTAHYAIGLKVRDEALAQRVHLSWPSADQHSESGLERIREAVNYLQVQARAVGDVSASPFQLVGHGEWTPSWERGMQASAGGLATAVRAVDRACTALCSAIELALPDRSLARLEAVRELADTLARAYRRQTAYALEADGQDRIDALEQAVTHLKAYAAAQGQLSCPYDSLVWKKLDPQALQQQWQQAKQAWFIKRLFATRAVRKALAGAGARGKPDPEIDIPALIELRKEGEAIERLDRQLKPLREWAAHDSDPRALDDARALAARVRAVVGRLVDTPQALVDMRARVRRLLEDGNDLLAPDAPVGRAAEDLKRSMVTLDEACRAFEAQAGKSVRAEFENQTEALEHMREAAEAIAERHSELNQWCGWQRRRNEALSLQLDALVEGIEAGRVPVDEIPETFEAAYCAWWSEKLLDEDEVLKSFSSAEHGNTIEQFRAFDEAFQRTTARYVAARLSAGFPGQSDVPQSSQWGVLKREITKRARHKPVRQLMEEAPEAIGKLAPCLMMSPLSVAQYLAPDQSLFDVVIFDEASQITVWDAVGAIARGKQVIVAGDPKQMPPTNFFGRADDDADGDVDHEGDLESILDELRSSNLPERALNLHYRSRRESLIAFSNDRYYDNGLVTFPAPVHPDRGVRLIKPEGFYDRGKSRTNRGEAEAIVKEIVRRLTHPDPIVRKQSIGVVTFNSEQQSLIEDLLDQARSEQQELEWAFGADLTEPVFVKNLETVQGDERDVILFSITYGPDRAGHVTMNFGPLNKQGGERRLNVALTRARSEMIVFSTLAADRIDLSRTPAIAVRDLKHFLEYADRGPAALGASTQGSLGDFESPFEAAVAQALRERGWTVHPQIGVSAFRVDLGIVHPDRPGVYLSGVECDGAMYHSSTYARERDKIRQAVLEGLGWTLLRVWSTDWWVNKASALERLDTALRAHLAQERAKPEPAVGEEPSPDQENSDPAPALSAPGAEPPGPFAGEPKALQIGQEEPLRRVASLVERPTPDAERSAERNREPGPSAATSRTTPYAFAHVEIDPGDEPLGDMSPAKLIDPVARVVEVESPVHVDDVIRRVTHAAGLQRAGRRIQGAIVRAIDAAAQSSRIRRKRDFLWCAAPHKVVVRDRSALAPQDKKFERVAPEEIAQAVLSTVARNFSLSREDAISEAARDLGFQRVTATMQTRFSGILAILVNAGKLREADGMLSRPRS